MSGYIFSPLSAFRFAFRNNAVLPVHIPLLLQRLP